jgi:hypothetical protein
MTTRTKARKKVAGNSSVSSLAKNPMTAAKRGIIDKMV